MLQGVDKKYRTRRGAQIQATLRDVEKKKPGSLKKIRESIKRARPPRKLADGRAIYSGSWRSFTAKFAAEWWNQQPQPWCCNVCNKKIDEDGDHGDAPSIDHLKPWASIKTEIRTIDVCCNGCHWHVALTRDVRRALQDPDNLVPTHQSCNSSKNGPKDTDSIAPQKGGSCPGGKLCKQPKARS